jgi:FkbM family methyltransferase
MFPFKILTDQLYLKALIAMKRKILPDYLRALLLKMLHGGPSFSKEADLWVVGHGSEKIHIPILRRYTMYKKGINLRLRHMLTRYDVGDINGALVLDIGAHIGEFAMAASPYAKKILCFEPDPVARAALIKNVSNLGNVVVLPIALSNETGVSTFHIATTYADSSLFKPSDVPSNSIQVKTKRLDDLGIDFSGYTRSVLKMDAEGFEPEVLQGGKNTLAQLSQTAIDVSPERGGEDTYADVKELLDSSGLIEEFITDDMVLVSKRP